MNYPIRAAALAAAFALASGAAQAQTLTLGVGAPVTSLDPHYHNLAPNNAMADTLYDALTHRDARARLVPGLAESWRAVDEDTWEFKLRSGVRFHNGSEFTAEDVAFTLRRVPEVPNSPSSFAAFTRPITEVEVVDPLTIRLSTNGPYPLLPGDLSFVRMLDKQTHEGATTEDFNSGKAAIGTGPYRLVSYQPDGRVELARNEHYWGGKPAWERVNYRVIDNDASRTAALLAGDVDLIDQVATSDMERLRRDSDVQVSEVQGLRVIYLALDHSRDGPSPGITGKDGQPLDRNPLKDPRVRRALSLAIDRDAIVERVMEGAAVPSGQFLPPGTYSHVPGREAPDADLDEAKRLLAEAGYPDGFRIVLAGPNNRYINDGRIIQAIAQMWTRLGVQTAVEAQPWSAFVGRAGRQEFSAFLVGWGSSSGEASSPLRALVATYDRTRGWGASNRGRYSNLEVDRLLGEALGTLDDEERERLLIEAQRVALDDLAIIPLHHQKNVWAMRPGLEHTPRADELTRPQDVRSAKAGGAARATATR
jgi:peptide/nickel transport system substrate-binding protein